MHIFPPHNCRVPGKEDAPGWSCYNHLVSQPAPLRLPGQGIQTSIWDVAFSPTGEEVALIIYSPFPPERGLVLYDPAAHRLTGSFSPPAQEALLCATYLSGRDEWLASGQIERGGAPATGSPPGGDRNQGDGESALFAYVIGRDLKARRRLAPLPGKKVVPVPGGEMALVSAFGYEAKGEPASLHLLDLTQGKTTAIPLDEGIEQGDIAGILPVAPDRVMIAAGGRRNQVLWFSPPETVDPACELPYPPSGLWWSPRGYVYVAHLFHKRLSQLRLDPHADQLELLREIPLGQGPATMAFHPREPVAFVLAHFTRIVFVLDELEGGKIGEIELKRSPLCLLPREDGLWALFLDLKRWEIEKSKLYPAK